MNQVTSHFRRLGERNPTPDRIPLGQQLLASGVISVADLLDGLSLHKGLNIPLGKALLAQGRLSEVDLYDHLALQWEKPRQRNLGCLDRDLLGAIGLDYCLRHRVIPIGIVDGVLRVAASDLSDFNAAYADLEDQFGLVTPVISSPAEVDAAIQAAFSTELADRAAHDIPKSESCRGLAENTRRRSVVGALVVLLLLTLTVVWPAQVLVSLTILSITLSLSSAALKTLALFSHVLPAREASKPADDLPVHPVVSIMVPLHREPDIAEALIERLSRLSYPKPLLEILLVIEENDTTTRNAIEDAELPNWMKPVFVPEGQPKTKPRALNHAYKFCRGDIIGIYDAEDMPAPDQIERVIAQFKTSGPEVACLQGILQFYNPRQNWLARCFTMDYAGWFRIILPGLARLGLPVPLGGTTLFLKRSAIDKVHGWDAYNVTEDADLGLRLHRAGYRTHLVDSITGEEANCHGWRWIRQRSRWIKGYMVTYWAHMRQPLGLMRGLGFGGFLAFQILFLGTILHFMTAPLLWSFWLVYFGINHAFFNAVPPGLVAVTALSFLMVEVLGMVILGLACIRADRRFLLPWIPTMSLYFLLAVPAGLKALWEFFRAPVFWDKTDHGHSLKPD